jgi:hypothetical protein
MTKKIYKYIGPDILDIAFKKDGSFGFKLSYPKDYNDPYELFLTIDFSDDHDVVAFYNEIVREIPQLPTSCFSKSPVVTPMWAHYAHNSKGFVIEIDEDKLKEHLGDMSLGDVKYQDTPRSELSSSFDMAYQRGKPRDMMFFCNGVQSAAYFTKNTCWNYELERRLVVSNDDITVIDGNMILFIPTDCVTAIISGPRTKQDFKDSAADLCNEIDSQYLEANIGKSSSKPYFLDLDSNTYTFNDDNIISCNDYCDDCKEPVVVGREFCSWCSITAADENYAASGNPLRALSDAGILSDYIRGFNSIGK